jgi:hypothetical protein
MTNMERTMTTASLAPEDNSSVDAVVECLKVRRALCALYDIADRKTWQVDLNSALLEQDNKDEKFDPLGDHRFEGILEGLNLFFRFFEVRADLSFRHQVDRFDAGGFLRLSGPWSYSDIWWDTVSQDNIKLAEEILVHAGMLEFWEIDTGRAIISDRIITCIRLRADRIVEVLKNFEPSKYCSLHF